MTFDEEIPLLNERTHLREFWLIFLNMHICLFAIDLQIISKDYYRHSVLFTGLVVSQIEILTLVNFLNSCK